MDSRNSGSEFITCFSIGTSIIYQIKLCPLLGRKAQKAPGDLVVDSRVMFVWLSTKVGRFSDVTVLALSLYILQYSKDKKGP